jgi:uncharacterized protein involved in response to NO
MNPHHHHALWLRGFRPFFLGAAFFATINMVLWLGVLHQEWNLDISGLTIFQWHAHEMIYGYALAVVAGFLLTATQNWTGRETLNGKDLAGLFALWVMARVFMAMGPNWLLHAAIADIFFVSTLTMAISGPVFEVRQWRQLPVLGALVFLTAGGVSFYLGLFMGNSWLVSASVYAGLYLVLGMILFMGRRVIPFFTERGVGYEVVLKNSRWNDWLSWPLFLAFVITEAFFRGSPWGALVAATLFVMNGLRLAGWYTPGIRSKPLLWSLYLAYLLITIGFALRALEAIVSLPPLSTVHVFGVGGIGLVTISMMPRVSLGHTGRSVHEAPPVVTVFVSLMVLSAVFRVLLAWMDPGHYRLWLTVSGIFWIVAFALFIVSVGPMLVRARTDAISTGINKS